MEIEPLTLQADGLKLRGALYLPRHVGKGPYPALILCHGVPGGPPPRAGQGDDGGYPALAEWFCAEGLAVLIFNFRGTGESEGNFDMWGWTRDLAAAVELLLARPEIDAARLSLMGFSGGASACAYVAAHDSRVSSLVLCACSGRMGRMGDEVVERLLAQGREIGIIRDPGFPPSLEEWRAGFERVSPARWVERLGGRPLLIIHGSSDELIPVEAAWQLYERAGEPKEIIIAQGGEHKLRLHRGAMASALDWLKKVNGLAK